MLVKRSGRFRETASNAESVNPFDKENQRHRKRATLLNEALRMIHERGAASISLDDLASNLEISKGTVYYYFKSKDELLFECYSISFDIWEKSLDTAQSVGKMGAEKIEIFLRAYLSEGLGTLHVVSYLRDQSALHGDYRDEAETRRQELRNRMRALIEEGNADGSLGGADPSISATILGASITWLLRAYQPDGAQTKVEYIENAISVMLNGLRCR